METSEVWIDKTTGRYSASIKIGDEWSTWREALRLANLDAGWTYWRPHVAVKQADRPLIAIRPGGLLGKWIVIERDMYQWHESVVDIDPIDRQRQSFDSRNDDWVKSGLFC